ncbi:MAG TPA: dipeptide/oligopeptide/nickel ABC transporter ATP-binding protein [Gemmataceae bacterium]|jgi:ABC-type glutathione transport system ATPase component
MSSLEPILRATDLRFAYPAGPDGPGFELAVPQLDAMAGETLALCGPSGSGKSTLLSILAGLLRPEVGQVLLAADDGWVNVHAGSGRAWRRHRRHLGFVHQDPREYLNDRRTVADIVADPLAIHGQCGRKERRERAVAALRDVGITEEQSERMPGALSGGQRQRVAIARAFVGRPQLIFLDEPTSALDVSVQAAIVELLRRLRNEDARTAYILVTHDLALARQLADRVVVLDRGRAIEWGEVDQVIGAGMAEFTDGVGFVRQRIDCH